MATLSIILIIIVALLHYYFLVLEMFYWDKPLGLKAFGLTPEEAETSKVLAANQGLYNGFLATGLLYGLIQGESGFEFKVFFLACVIIAGVYGAVTANKRILYIQAMPATLALVSLFLSQYV